MIAVTTELKSKKEFKITLTARTGKVTSGSIFIHIWTKQERLKRALKFGGLCWGLSAISILLPLAHFILVPLFFLAGPIVAIVIYKQMAFIEEGQGPCPFCQAIVIISKGPMKWPSDGWSTDELCTSCQNNSIIKVEP
jgi:hypothetical protein